MARRSGKRQTVPRSVIAFAVVLFLLPGGIFFAKGLLTLVDRFAPRSTVGATLLEVDTRTTTSPDGETTLYIVRGEAEDGRAFEINDEQVYDLASDRLPMAVQVDRVGLTGRVAVVRSDFGTVTGVGGGDRLRFAVLGLGLGGMLGAIPFVLPWQPADRKRAKQRGKAPPTLDRGALVIVVVAALVIVGGTMAWDVVR